MIGKDEIDAKADELGVHVANVQRDYAFGWLLAGLAQAENCLRPSLILKGGNCFRKAYFEHARFSNDLDFSTQSELELSSFLCHRPRRRCRRFSGGGVRCCTEAKLSRSAIGGVNRDLSFRDTKPVEPQTFCCVLQVET
jgi:hypothetical protein